MIQYTLETIASKAGFKPKPFFNHIKKTLNSLLSNTQKKTINMSSIRLFGSMEY